MPLRVGFQHEIDQGLRAARRLLLDAPEPDVAQDIDRAAFRSDLVGDQAEQRGLAGAVARDETDMRAARQRDAERTERARYG